MQLPLIDADDGREQFCVFRAGAEFCLPLGSVAEVIPFPKLTPVPRAPGFLLGIAEHAGGVVPVLDLNRRVVRAAPKRWSAVVLVPAEMHGRSFLLGFAAEHAETAAGTRLPESESSPSFAPGVVDFGNGRRANLLNIATAIEVFCLPPL
jgi:purine-binding chemotaxis protein CheW